ncbi:MAG TPA: 5'-methylthioadenosine/S-adenosylhomocysteine nucleosidase [Actinotalea sp.]|nr:5'-methylthioadenosine/S-adenosylhomocysteine nucleosidase [Actinotalea sp.]
MTDVVVAVAMAEEAEPFRARADRVSDAVQVGHAEHAALSLGGLDVLLVATGIGLVRATAAVTLALHGHGPVPVISAGSAGGLAPEVRVGDVVVGDRYAFHGADATAFGYQPGQIPGMPPFYQASARYLAAAAASAALADGTVRTGAMLSGDAFGDSRTVGAVRDTFPDALSTDMETAAIAQTCHLMGAEFLGARGISDLCGPVAGQDFRTHVDDAADRSADVVLALLRAL